MTQTHASYDPQLDAFYADVESADLQPLWTQASKVMPMVPRPSAVPWLWQGTTLRALAGRALDLITIERGGERRVLGLANPGLGGAPFSTPTLWSGIQALGPRESAPAHRHAAAAIRFILEGEGAWTTVNGDACRMSPGDLVLTPAWTFHEHANGGDTPMLWFDGLDLPLMSALDVSFYENYPELQHPVVGFDQSTDRYGTGRVPYGDAPSAPHSPLLRYRWGETDAMLSRMAAATDAAMASIEFVSPASGVPLLPTLTCAVHRLKPGARTRSRRKVGSSVFVVFRGAGRSVIAGTAFEWTKGDVFAVPSWAALDHEAESPSDLFELSDEAVMRALHVFREENLDEHQPVEGTFSPKAVTGA